MIFCFGLLSIFWKEKRTGYHGRMKVVQLSLRKGTKINLYGNSVYLLSNKSKAGLSLTISVQEFVIFFTAILQRFFYKFSDFPSPTKT